MPVRDLIVAACLIAGIVAIAFGASALESEYYLFLPGGPRSRGLHEPPTSPWLVLILLALPIGVFFFSRRYAAGIITILPILALLGWAVGTLFFDWTPGMAQYLIIFGFGLLAIFVWSRDSLNED